MSMINKGIPYFPFHMSSSVLFPFLDLLFYLYFFLLLICFFLCHSLLIFAMVK